MKKKFLLGSALALSLFYFKQEAFAQSEAPVDLIPSELRGELNKILSNGVNGLVIFSSSSSLGSGYFNFDSGDSEKEKLDVLKLQNSYDLVEPNSQPYVPFVRGGVGKVKYTESILPVEGDGINDFSTVTTSSITLGGGADIRIMEGFFVTPSFDLAYSHTENHYDFNNAFSQNLLALFDRDVFNWDVDTLSYDPGMMVRYEQQVGSAKLIPSVAYTQVFVDSFWTNSRILDVNTSSGVLKSQLRTEVNTGVSSGDGDIYLVPQVARTDIYKDARAGLDIKYYHDVSLTVLEKNQHTIPFFNDIGLTGGYSFAPDFNGWRIGFEASL